jgi:anti-sigma factor RsiW
MDCTRCTENLTAFLDGELSAADSEQASSHLSACASCAEEWRSLREAARFVESHRRELEVRPEVWNLVRARISVPSEAPSLFDFLAPGRWRFAVATLAIVVVIVLGYVQYQQLQRRSLDKYISQYMQDRQAHAPSQPVFTDFAANHQNKQSRADNPFAEFKATLSDNPFRLEDR